MAGNVDDSIFGGVVLDFGHVFASDHFEEELVLLFEAGGEFFEVGLVGDVNRPDETDGKVFFLVGGDAGLQTGGLFVLIDPNEVGGFLSLAIEGEGAKNGRNPFHPEMLG